jgi:hypothetical protein
MQDGGALRTITFWVRKFNVYCCHSGIRSLPYHDPAPDGTARAQHAFLGGGGRVQGLDVVRSQTRDVGNSPALREGGRPAT